MKPSFWASIAAFPGTEVFAFSHFDLLLSLQGFSRDAVVAAA